jgi:hypothetical protein
MLLVVLGCFLQVGDGGSARSFSGERGGGCAVGDLVASAERPEVIPAFAGCA